MDRVQKIRDSSAVRQWIASNASLAEIENSNPVGIVGNVRFSSRAVRQFRKLWTWSAVRFSSIEQDYIYSSRGHDFYLRRIERVSRIIRAIKARG